MYFSNDIKVKVIYVRKFLSLLNFYDTCFQPNTSSPYLPGQTYFIKISDNTSYWTNHLSLKLNKCPIRLTYNLILL